MIGLSEEQIEVIDHLVENNDFNYNLHKASEEFQELGLVLNQILLKPTKVDPQEVIDEIGDAYIRLEILKKIYDNKAIQDRINFKLGKFKEYIDNNLYQQI